MKHKTRRLSLSETPTSTGGVLHKSFWLAIIVVLPSFLATSKAANLWTLFDYHDTASKTGNVFFSIEVKNSSGFVIDWIKLESTCYRFLGDGGGKVDISKETITKGTVSTNIALGDKYNLYAPAIIRQFHTTSSGGGWDQADFLKTHICGKHKLTVKAFWGERESLTFGFKPANITVSGTTLNVKISVKEYHDDYMFGYNVSNGKGGYIENVPGVFDEIIRDDTVPIFFKHCDFGADGGYAIPLSDKSAPDGRAKEYTLSDLESIDIENDDLSSVYIPRGYKVTLYKGDNFTGDSLVLKYGDSCLTEEGFNDSVSSIKVEKIVAYFIGSSSSFPNYPLDADVKYSYGAIGAWGGTGGSAFDAEEMLKSSSIDGDELYITKIGLRAGSRVDQVNVTYNNGSVVEYGGSGGSAQSKTLSSGTTLKKMKVCKDDSYKSMRVHYIKFTLSDGSTLSGGTQKGDCTILQATDGSILGFHGKSGAELDSIGIITETPREVEL